MSFKKGFNPTLFDAIDNALVSVLGRPAVSTFYFHIGETHNIFVEEFKERPLEVLRHLQNLLGLGFAVLNQAVLTQIRETFSIPAEPKDIEEAVELAKKSYLQATKVLSEQMSTGEGPI